MRHTSIALLLLLLCACTQDSSPDAAAASSYDWPNYANDPGASKYADLEQINRDTVAQLEIAWVWESVDNAAVAERPQFVPSGFKATPIKIEDTLYVSTSLGHALRQYVTGSRGGTGCRQRRTEVGVQYLNLGTRPAGKQRI